MAERAAVYVRVSSDIQRDNYSPPTQLKACREYAEKYGYALVGDRFVDPVTAYDAPSGNGAIPAYVDDYTSRELSRPALDAAFEYAKTSGFDVLIVQAIDRLARDPYIRQTLEREFAAQGITVRYVLGDYDDTPEGEVRKDMEATFSKWEQTKRVERSKRGKKGKAERGLWPHGSVLYGYTNDDSAPGGLAVIEEQAEVVRRIYELCIDGFSISKIAKQLIAEGKKPVKGGDHWGTTTIVRILHTKTYTGTTYWGKHKCNDRNRIPLKPEEWVPIKITPLIDEATFAMAQLKLADNRARFRRPVNRRYLLGGLVVCAECGLAYITHTMGIGHARRKTEGTAYRHRKSHGHCRNGYVNGGFLEKAVWEAVKGLLLDPTSLHKGYEHSLEQEQAAQGRKRTQVEVLERAEFKVKQQLENLLRAYTDPELSVTKAQYLTEKQRLETELHSVTSRRQIIEAQLALIPGPADLAALETYAADIREFLEGGIEPTFDEKRKIFEMLHVKVIIDAEGSKRIEGWFGDPVLIDGLLSQQSQWWAYPMRP